MEGSSTSALPAQVFSEVAAFGEGAWRVAGPLWMRGGGVRGVSRAGVANAAG